MKISDKIHPLTLLFFLIFILFSPVLFSTKLFPGFDLLLVFYPYSFHYLTNHSFWTSGILSGFGVWISASSFAGNWFYYFSSLKLFDFVAFYNVLISFYFILNTLFSYLAARKLGFDKFVATVVTSVFIFSAYNLSWMVNIVTAPSLFIFPALIYFLLKFKENVNWLWPIFGGVILGFGLLVSHPQFALIGAFSSFIFSLFLVFESGTKRPEWKFLIAFLAICLIGFSVAGFQLIPEYQLSKFTQRGEALNFSASQECALSPFDFIRYFLPNFNFLVSCESLLYIGVLPLILALFAAFWAKENRKLILFWLACAVFTLLFSIKYSPLAWIFHQLPVWQSLRGPARFLILGNFALANLAGYGFNWILENPSPLENSFFTFRRKAQFSKGGGENLKNHRFFLWLKRFFYSFLLLVVVVNTSSLFKNKFISWASSYFDKYYYARTTGLLLKHYHQVISNLISDNFYAFSFVNKDFIIPFLLAVAAFFSIFFISKLNKTTFFYIFILSGFLWAVSSPMVSSGQTRNFFAEPKTAEFLKAQKGIFRIYSLMPGLATYQLLVSAYSGVTHDDEDDFLKAMLPPNLNLIYGLDSIDGYDAFMPRRTSRVLAEVLSERATVGNRIIDLKLKPEEKITIFESRANLLSMMNVKYIISAYALDEKIFKKVFETKITRFQIPIYIYENTKALPYFYFAKNIEFVEGDEMNTLKAILNSKVDFNAKTFVECGSCTKEDSNQATIDSFEYKNGYLRFETNNVTDSWFIFSESYDASWQAKINGQASPIYRANYIYQTVKVPSGKNLIEFKYKP